MKVPAGLTLAILGSTLALSCHRSEADVPDFNSPLPEISMSEGPDGLYITRLDGPWATDAGSAILYAEPGSSVLRSPSFADPEADEGDFYFSPEREEACFTSDRAVAGDIDIWCVRWAGDGWAAPTRMPEPINSESTEYSPVLRPDGSLYFASDRPGLGGGDLYHAVLRAEAWAVERLPASINSEFGEWNLEISPDGERLIFEASERPGNRSVSGDLYVSRRTGDSWTTAVPLSRLNGVGSELMPRFLSDGSLTYAQSSGDDADVMTAEPSTWEPITPMIAAVARSAGELVLLDPETLAVTQRIPAGVGPHDVAVSEDGRFALVPSHGVFPAPHEDPIEPSQMRWMSESSDGFRIVDLATGAQIAHRPLDGCERPHGAAITAQAERFWITCENEGHVREFDGATFAETRRFELANGVHKVMLLQDRSILVASNTDTGGIDLIDLDTGDSHFIATGNGAEGLAATGNGSRVFVTNGGTGEVCVVDVAAPTRTACWNSGGIFPIGLAHDAQRGWIWVVNNASSNLVALDDATGEVRRDFALPSRPLGIAFDVRADRLLIGLPRRNEVIAVNAASGDIVLRSEQVMEVDDIDPVPASYFRHSPDT
ncbi:hypothetical protein [Parasphingopyxis sp.]|uniref:hypothetical protein n=1 Tax=Parasphingopyxis sp. TaxID=1920299 RepID=UPI0026087FCA|nr:hypothetical protein [Parasphingopyxis sp.]